MEDTLNYEPRPLRFAISQSVLLVRADGTESSATFMNVSQHGFGLKVTDAPAVGERVLLRGAAGDVPAEVRWTKCDEAGGIFLPSHDN
jgi:hypothetical protein